jgi:hypothetical protein
MTEKKVSRVKISKNTVFTKITAIKMLDNPVLWYKIQKPGGWASEY